MPVKKKVRLKDRRRLRSYISALMYAALLVALLGGVAYVSRLPELTVATVEIEGATHTDRDAVYATVVDALHGSYLFLVPRRMSYVVPQGALSAAVIDAFPTVASAEVERLSDTELVVRLVEREQKAVWCRREGAECFALDAHGFIFDEARPGEFRRYRGLVTEPIGAIFLEGGFQDFDAFVDRVARATGREVAEVHLDDLDVFLTLAGGGEIRFTRAADPERVLGDLLTVFSAPEFGDRPFTYVELRFGTNAVVQFAD